MFLVFEGVDGSGKSTQARLLADRIRRERRKKVLLVREPGATRLGEKVRAIVLHSKEDLAPETELFLFMAARSHLVRTRILPALRRGEVVISDRFLWSSAVYQGYVVGNDPREILRLGKLATSGVRPTRTFVLDVDPRSGLSRVESPNRMESKGLAFQKRVRRGFLQLARQEGKRCVVIDAAASVDEVHERIVAALPARGWT